MTRGDVPFGPTKGHFYAIDVYGYGRAIGSEAQFAKVFLQAFTFKEVLPRTIWAQAVRAGVAVTFGLSHSDPASTGDDESGVPQTERFFAGGDTTLRGFPSRPGGAARRQRRSARRRGAVPAQRGAAVPDLEALPGGYFRRRG